MTNYPTLKEMGIENPEEISKYTLTQIDNADHLRVVYKRKTHSLRPISKRFIFGRFKNTMVVDSGAHELENVDEISPHLLKAVAELDKIVNSSKQTKQQSDDLKNELIRLESEIVANLASIRTLIDSIERK